MSKLLQELCQLAGISSHEEVVRNYILDVLKEVDCSTKIDTMGNLIVHKKGKVTPKNKLLISAHMDEVGFMVKNITKDGYIKFEPIGGMDRRVLLGKSVLVGERKIPGIIAVKAFHLMSASERESVPKYKDLYIDIGAENEDEAKKLISLGDQIVFDTETIFVGEKQFSAKAIDDRIGCAIMLKLLKSELPMDCTFVFSVQEEVGTRGAFAYSFGEKPKIALVLEGTTAADLPTMDGQKKVCLLGRGPVIPFMDGGSIYDKELYALATKTAKEKNIPWQTKHYVSGGTDAGTIQRSCDGIKILGISAPVRYLHSGNGMVNLEDYAHMKALTFAFFEALAERELGGEAP